MKLTKTKLRQIIKEEINLFNESTKPNQKKIEKTIQSVLGKKAGHVTLIGGELEGATINLYGLPDSDFKISVIEEDDKYYVAVVDEEDTYGDSIEGPIEVPFKKIENTVLKLTKKHKKKLSS